MKIQSAIVYACAGAVGGFIGELWRVRQGGRPPELGLVGAAVGLVLFGVLFAGMIYFYGAVSRMLRSEERLAAYVPSAVLGLPFWFVLNPVHELLRDRFGLPDGLWWVETAVLCAASFEIIRLSSKLLTKA